MRRHPRSRRGFVLLAVLWMLTGVAILGLLLTVTSRDALGTARNRINLTRARWRAEGCVERAKASVEDAASGRVISDSVWFGLDGLIARARFTTGCTLSVRPAGLGIAVNDASVDELRALLAAAGVTSHEIDSLSAAILDWRDADDSARPDGAERDWYEAAGRVPPRNGDFSSLSELAMVRGLESRPDLVELFSVERDRIFLARAPIPVLAVLPGMTSAVLALIGQRRLAGDFTLDLQRLAANASPDVSVGLLANTPRLASLVTSQPEAWIITSSASEGQPRVTARLELRVARSGGRLAVLRRRSDR